MVVADERGRPADADARARCDLVVGDLAMPFLERDPHLHPCEVGAETAVRTRAERDIPGPAAEVDGAGVLMLGGVMVGRGDGDRDVGVRWDESARQFDIARCHPGTVTTGPSKRSNSSTASGMTAGSATISWRSRGVRARAANAVLSAEVTVSRPASTNRKDRPRISSSVSRCSLVSARSRLKMSVPPCWRRCAM